MTPTASPKSPPPLVLPSRTASVSVSSTGSDDSEESFLSPRDIGRPHKRTWNEFHYKLPEPLQRFCKYTVLLLDSAIVLVVIALVTLITIFLDDIKVYSFSTTTADYDFACITCSILALFGAEMIVNCLVRPGYFGSGFFLMDLVSTFSLLPDITWIWYPMIGLPASASDDDGNSDTQVEVARIKRVSATSAKLLKVLKFVKLIRLGRIAKLFEMAQRTIKERARISRVAARAAEADLAGNDQEENALNLDDYTQSSQVGQTLSEQTIRNVVLLVLLMLFGIPMLQPTTTEGAEQFMVSELTTLAGGSALLGNVTALLWSNGTYSVFDGDETDVVPVGATYEMLGPEDLAPMLASYDSLLGQPSNKGDIVAGSLNTTYIKTVVTTQNYAVAYEALLHASAVMEQQYQWVLAYYTDSILYLRVRGQYYSNDFQSTMLFLHRVNEMRASEDGVSVCVFSIRSIAQLAAWYSIWRAFTTLLLLFIGAIAFDYNNKRMVIAPIERMVATIVQLRKNPLAKAVIEDGDEAAAKAKGASSADSTSETGMLERTLQKLTGLLQIGFGDAGSRMIQKCMAQNNEGDLDPLVDGTRMLAIFGFCDIRRFTDATECLREDVMMYVNEIASIVHSHVSICDGHPNKNVGDAFLVMWRLNPHGAFFDPDDLFQLNEKQPTYLRPTLETVRKRALMTSAVEREYADEQQRDVDDGLLFERAKQASSSYPPIIREVTALSLAQISVLADKAVVSFLRIIVDLDASPQLRAYERHPRILAAFDDFTVQLGFGLHCGWSIEGPIGSRYKIDASYLSPHVNLSEALQDLTKIYGTPLLVSGEFYTLLSPYLKAHMRRVDVVKVVGRDIPMNLYAFDIHPRAMKTIIARETPDEYDLDADIDVVVLKPSTFARYKPPPPPQTPSSTGDSPKPPISSPLSPQSPLSPLSPGAVDPSLNPLLAHALFANPALNPLETDFSEFTYSGADRERIHGYGPVATYHLVYNFRLSVLQCGIPYSFHDVYEAGLNLYLAGDWAEARTKMDECHELYPEDVPTTVILGVMAERDFKAPNDWPGWHEA